jgi:Fic family protein
MKPPYNITPAILELVAAISEKIGEISANHLDKPRAELRKSNRIKTIQASLDIEGNTMSTDQVTAIFENKRVLGPSKDILEVKNAIDVYDRLHEFKAASLASLLKAHKLMMTGLLESPGKFRTRYVGVVKGDELRHLAPDGEMVKPLIVGLLEYLKKSKDIALIKSCVFHYELEFIHPFMDGNGRLGRLWQTIILMEDYPFFEFLPVEAIIKRKQDRYYKALSASDLSGKSTIFVEFMLGVILESLEELSSGRALVLSAMERIERFRADIGTRSFARKDYLRKYKDISHATASRDLREGVKRKLLKKNGDKRNANYRFVVA